MFQNKIVATFCVVLLSLFSLEAQQQVTVWPGDTDNNGLVNNLDFLQIGLAYNYLGTVRDTATVQWSGQTASPWTTNPAGINSAYADANGDGLVNYFYDAFPVYVHYGLDNGQVNPTVYQSGQLGLDPPIFFDDASVGVGVQGGQAVSLPIHLGTEALPLHDFYGIAFSIHVDSTFIDTQEASLNFNQFSWVNNDGDRFSAVKRVSNTQIDVAWVRTDHNVRNGYGSFGSFDFIIIDDFIGLQQNTEIYIDKIKAVDRFGNEHSIASDTLQLMILPDLSTSQNAPSVPQTNVQIFPNPSQGHVWVDCSKKMQTIQVYDAFGSSVFSKTIQANQTQLQLESLPAGMYFMEIRTDKDLLRKRLFLNK